MTEDANKINVLDFIISVLISHEKKLEKHIDKPEQITSKLENDDQNKVLERLLHAYLENATKRQSADNNHGEQLLTSPLTET